MYLPKNEHITQTILIKTNLFCHNYPRIKNYLYLCIVLDLNKICKINKYEKD